MIIIVVMMMKMMIMVMMMHYEVTHKGKIISDATS